MFTVCMQSLIFLALALVNIALLVHLTEKVLGYRKRWRDNRLLVNNHPEMKLVDPGQGLMSFESDDVTRAFVLDNNEPGASEPFLIRDDEEFDEWPERLGLCGGIDTLIDLEEMWKALTLFHWHWLWIDQNSAIHANQLSVNKTIRNWIVKPIRATVFADRDAYYWIQSKLGLGNYQMADLVWAKGLIIGLLVGWIFLWSQLLIDQCWPH